MSDDQTLMDGMPASREFVLPEERKMYRGFQMPVFKTTEQEMRYKAAIDERDNFRSKAARQLPRQVEDYIKEPLRGVGRSAKEVGMRFCLWMLLSEVIALKLACTVQQFWRRIFLSVC